MASHSSLSESTERGHHPLPKQEAPSKEDHVSAQASEAEGRRGAGDPAPEHHWRLDAAHTNTQVQESGERSFCLHLCVNVRNTVRQGLYARGTRESTLRDYDWAGGERREMHFSLLAQSLLTFDPRLQGKTQPTAAVATSGSGEGQASWLASVKSKCDSVLTSQCRTQCGWKWSVLAL